jgi:hypothetical protein
LDGSALSETSEDDASTGSKPDGGAALEGDATFEMVSDSGPDSASTEDPGPVDAGACNGFAHYNIPAGHYAYGRKCTGHQLSSTVHVPPTQEECKVVVNSFDEQCIKWNAFTKPLTIYFKQFESSDCDIQIFPKLETGDTYKCTKNN